MDIDKKAIEITIFANKEIASALLEDLESIGMEYSNSIAGRRVLLQERKGLFKMLGTGKSLVYDPITIITFLVSSEVEQTIINYMYQLMVKALKYVLKTWTRIMGRRTFFS